MQHILEPNGNVTFIVGDGREELETIKERVGGNDALFLAQMLDCFGYIGNARFTPISAEHISAQTEAPMFSDGVEHLDDGDVEVYGDVWYFPNYALEDFASTLLEKGRVTFRVLH
jgi:hypothetical protein